MNASKTYSRGTVIALCFAVLLGANATFLLVRLLGDALPRARVETQLRAAFADGSLTVENYPTAFAAGFDQYTDCATMQLAVVGNAGVLENALAPRILSEENATRAPEARVPHRCAELKAYLDGTGSRDSITTYTRFWHGQSSVLSAALLIVPVGVYRWLLLLSTLALIFLCALRADGALRIGLAPMLLVISLIGGQLRFGQLMSYAPSQVACWGLALFIVSRRVRLTATQLMLLAVLGGSIEAFFDMMISVPLVAGIFLIVAAAVSLPRWRQLLVSSVIAETIKLGIAWVLGFLGTYAVKLLLTSVVLGWRNVILPFVDQLRFRVGVVDAAVRIPEHTSRIAMIANNIHRLGGEFWRLGYTNSHQRLTSGLIAGIALAGWLWTAYRIVIARREGRVHALLINGAGYVAATVLLLSWVAVFPEHTWRHSWFMVRATTLWIAAGWGWALTDRAARQAAAN